VEPSEFTGDSSAASPNPHHRVALAGHLTEEAQRSGHEPLLGYKDPAVERDPSGSLCRMYTQAEVGLLQYEFLILFSDTEAIIEEGGTEGAQWRSDGGFHVAVVQFS
jgi:hypothetical protein